MSVIAELFSARSFEAVPGEAEPERPPGGLRHENITIVELSLLWCLVAKQDWAPALLKEFECVHRRENGDCTVHRLPEAFVSSLSAVAADRIGALAVDWSSAPELAATPSSVAPFIRGAVELSRRANEANQAVFLWTEGPRSTPGLY